MSSYCPYWFLGLAPCNQLSFAYLTTSSVWVYSARGHRFHVTSASVHLLIFITDHSLMTIRHFTSTLVVMLHLCTTDRKHGTNIDFMWRHSQSAGEMPYNAVYLLKIICCLVSLGKHYFQLTSEHCLMIFCSIMRVAEATTWLVLVSSTTTA